MQPVEGPAATPFKQQSWGDEATSDSATQAASDNVPWGSAEDLQARVNELEANLASQIDAAAEQVGSSHSCTLSMCVHGVTHLMQNAAAHWNH